MTMPICLHNILTINRLSLWCVEVLTGEKSLMDYGNQGPDNDDAADAIDYDIIKQCTRVITLHQHGDVRLLVAPEDDGGFRLVALNEARGDVPDMVMSRVAGGYQWCFGPAASSASNVWHTMELALDFGLAYMCNLVYRHRQEVAHKRQQDRAKLHQRKQAKANCHRLLMGLGQGRYTYDPSIGVHAAMPLPGDEA